MMPPDELATLSPSHRELAATSPALRFIVLLGLLDAFGPLGIDMYLPAFPRIERNLNAPNGAMQLTLSLFLAGLAIGQLICGPISDRVGRRVPLLYGSAAFAVASLTCAFTRSIEALILARFVMGLAGSTGMVIARAVVRDTLEEADSSRIYSMLMLVIGIAPIISPSVGGWLMQIGGWGSIFWALAGFACICGVAVAIDLPETHPPARRNRDSIATVFRRYAALRRRQIHGLCRAGQPGTRIDIRVCCFGPIRVHAVFQPVSRGLQPHLRRQCHWLDRRRSG